MVKILAERRLKGGGRRDNGRRLLSLIGCLELLPDAIIHPKDTWVAQDFTILNLLSPLRLSPETTTHWVMFSIWTYGRPSGGYAAYSCQPKPVGPLSLSLATYKPSIASR